jgi:cyclohexyl-isocyanide hydratase
MQLWLTRTQLDVLHVPGGFGQEALMEDEDVLAWISRQAAGAHSRSSVCTGALLCGAAGLLKGASRDQALGVVV